jgi:hypothetical protein
MVLLKVEMNISLSFFENQFSYLTFFIIKVGTFFIIFYTHKICAKKITSRKFPFTEGARNGHLSRGDLGAAESLDDDIVSVEPDDDHRHNGTGSKHRSQTPVEAACCKYKGF